MMHALGCLAYSARSLHVPASGRYADLDICTKPSAGCLNSPSLAMCCALELDSVMRFVDNDSITGYWEVMFPSSCSHSRSHARPPTALATILISDQLIKASAITMSHRQYSPEVNADNISPQRRFHLINNHSVLSPSMPYPKGQNPRPPRFANRITQPKAQKQTNSNLEQATHAATGPLTQSPFPPYPLRAYMLTRASSRAIDLQKKLGQLACADKTRSILESCFGRFCVF